jgi:hypothetical protein
VRVNELGNHGCPTWVRVIPGTHTFEVKLIVDANFSTYKYAEVPLKITDMQPKHVYVVHMTPSAGHVESTYEDIGPNSTAPFTICFVRTGCTTAEFE